jgi:hypothetical protein
VLQNEIQMVKHFDCKNYINMNSNMIYKVHTSTEGLGVTLLAGKLWIMCNEKLS